MMEKALFELIKTYASGRIYALRAPQNVTAPFVVFQRIDSDRWRSLTGPSGVAQATVQIDCYAETYYAAKELSEQIEQTLDGYQGIVYFGSDSPLDSVYIGGISLQNDSDIIDQTDEPLLYRNTANYLVTYYT